MAETGLRGPFLVDGVTYEEWQPFLNPTIGPYVNGTDLYIVYEDSTINLSGTIFKSTDKGATWAVLHTLAEPTSYHFTVQAGSTSHLRIYVTLTTGGALNAIYDFDMSSDSDAPSLVDKSWASPPSIRWGHYNHVTDEDILFYSSSTEIWVRRFKSGSWQTGQKVRDAVVSNTSWRYSCATDGDGDTFIFSVPRSAGAASFLVECTKLLADGTLGSTYSSLYDCASSNANHLARPSIINDSVILPLHELGKWLVGTPLSGPSFSSLSAPGKGAYSNVSNDYTAHLPGVTGYLWWLEHYDADWNRLDLVLRCRFDGVTRGSTETVHDEYNNPSFPAIDPDAQFCQHPSPPVQLEIGRWAMCLSMYMPPDGSYWPHYYWEYRPPVGFAAIGRGTGAVSISTTGGYAHVL